MSVDPGKGYRLLHVGEQIEQSDQFLMDGTSRWYQVTSPHSCKKVTPNHVPIRRALPAPTGTESAVCADIAARQRLGVAKYGKTVADNPLTLKEWLQHAYEECLDQAVYLRRAIDETQNTLPR